MKMAIKYLMLITLAGLLGLMFSALAGCKKEVVSAPSVTISRPFVNQSFGFGDTIWVDAQVSHENISAVTLTLVNSGFQPVEEVISIPVKGNSFSFQSYIVIENVLIESGKHSVRVQVVAQGESFNTFVAVNIAELQKQRIAIYAASSDGANRQLYRLEGAAQMLSQSSFGDVSGIAVNSFLREVYLAPEFLGDLRLYKSPTDSLIWQDPNTAGSGGRFMRGVCTTNDGVFGFYADGRVVRFGANGGISLVIQMPIAYQAIDVLLMQNYVLLVGETLPSKSKALFYYNKNSSALIRKIDLLGSLEHIDLLQFDENTLAVLYNDASNQASWQGFQLNGTFITLPNLPVFTFTAAARISNGQFALGSNLGVYQFTYSPLNFIPISPVPPAFLVYDDLNNHLLLGAGSSLSLRTYPGMQIISAYSFASALKGVAVLYNK